MEDLEFFFETIMPKVKIEIILSKNLFIVEELSYYEEKRYNNYDYIVEFKSEYFFAVSREVIDEIIKKVKEKNIYLVGVYLNYEEIKEIENINFLSIEQRKDFVVEKINYLKYIIITIIILSLYIFLLIYDRNLEKNILEQKKENSILTRKLKRNEEFFSELSEKIEKQNILREKILKKNTIVFEILKKISLGMSENLFTDNIEINDSKVEIMGSGENMETIHKFEEKLYDVGLKKINNDYIINEEGNIYYKIDFYYDKWEKEGIEEND